MAIMHKYTLLCDEVRQENNGKFLIIGLYTPDIVVPQLPFALPSLSFFNVVEADVSGTVNFNFRLTQGDATIAGGAGAITMQRAGLGLLPIRLGQLALPAAGDYTFRLDFAESAPISHDFKVTLQVQNLGPAVPQGRSPVH